MRIHASSYLVPITFAAASQLAPHGAPFMTSISVIRPASILTKNFGTPNLAPYSPRHTCPESPHQVGGVKILLPLIFFPDAITGIFFFIQKEARSIERSGCVK